MHRASIHRNEINVMYENPLFDGITKIESDDNKKKKNNNNRGMFRKHPKLSTWICTFLVALISILYILYIAVYLFVLSIYLYLYIIPLILRLMYYICYFL